VHIHESTSDRRRFLALGGAVGTAAVLAACGKSDTSKDTSAATTTTAVAARDVALLQKASSLEELEVAIYQRGLDGGIIKTPAVLDTIKILQAQHHSHAGLFEGHTSRLGGQVVTAPNAVLLGQLQGRLAAAADEIALLKIAFDVALVTAATYEAAVGTVTDTRLNLVLMSIAGVEARHAALIGPMVNQPVAAGSFATTEKALA
jgi:hypothetical protein